MHLLTLNAVGEPLAAPRALDPRRRRLSQVIGRHVDKRRPCMIAVQRARDPLQPLGEAWVTRGWKVPPVKDAEGNVIKQGVPKPWPRRYLPADAVVVVVYLPRGGALGGGGRRGGKSPLNIALGIAGLALVAFAGPLAGALLPSLVFGSTAGTILQAGLVLGGTALLSLASRAKANKQATDTAQVFGVSGGGNLPKPGDRIPRGYGRSWMKPDLSQPDFSQYDGDNQILFKRHTLGVGKYHVYAIRVGKQTLWTEAGGFIPPFNMGGVVTTVTNGRIITKPASGTGPALEILYGQPSTLVPSNVVAATGVGGTLPRPADNPSLAGPFPINQRGALVTRLQVDFQFPQGISSSATKKSGAQLSNLPGFWSVLFEYAPIDDSGQIVGAWKTLYDGSNNTEGTRFATHPLRYTKFLDVPAGRYAVRGRNRRPDTTNNAGVEGQAVNIDVAQWDGASGWVGDVAVRPGVTEVCLQIYANSGNQAAAFGEIEIDAAAIIPVWNGAAWVEQETSKAVWAYLDVMRNADYGGGIPDDQIDLGTALGYAGSLTEFDTFDASIRGPVSVYEAAATVLLPMRAEPVHNGRFWSFVRDEPKTVRRHVITRRQILKGSTQIGFDLDTEAGAGHVIGEFDQDGDYRNPNQTTAIYGAASLTPTRQRWTGVRTYAHAAHLTRWRAAAGAYRRQTTPFGVEMEGRIYRRGDSIAVDPWFIDVRKVAGVVENSGNVLTLDADVVVAGGDVVQLRDRSGREWGPLAVTQGLSPRQIVLDPTARTQVEQATGLTLADVLSDGRRDMTTALVGTLETARENYLIQSVKMDGAARAQVEALIDDARVWDAIGASPGTPPASYAGITDPESPVLLGVTANVVPIAAGYRLDYTMQPGRGAATFEIGVSYDGGTRYDDARDVTPTGSVPLNPVDPTTLKVRARAFGATGLPGVYVYTTAALGSSAVNVALPPIAYADLAADAQARIAAAKTTADQAAAAAAAAASAATAAAQTGQQAAADALAQANTRLAWLRRGLAVDPAIRQGYVDPLIGDAQQSLSIVTAAMLRVQRDVAVLGDRMAAAGIEVNSAEGTVRISAVSRLETAVGDRITSLGIVVDALKAEIDLYGSVQTGDIAGLVSTLSAVQVRLNAAEGTISSLATKASVDALSSSLTSVQTTLSAQAGLIASKASQAIVDAQGTRLTTAETRISAAEGSIGSVVTATRAGAADAALLPLSILRGLDGLGQQLGAISANLARAETNNSANFDAQGRSVAEMNGRLLAFQGDAAAQFATVTRAIAGNAEAIVTQQTLFSAQIGAVSASLANEITVRTTADSAMTTRLDGALSRIGTAEAGLTSEQQTRAAADFAFATSLNSLTSRVGTAESGLTSLGQTVSTNASSTASQFNGVSARFGTLEGRADSLETRASASEANIQSLTTATANDRSANATAFQGITARFQQNEANLTSTYNTLASADQALGQRIDTNTSSIAGNTASITALSQTVSDNAGSTATQFSNVSARFGSVEGRATALEGRAATSEANIQSLQTSTANDRSANATAFQNISTRFGTNESSISSLSQAQSSATAAQANVNNDLYARSDAGTAAGRFYMAAVSAPSGVSVRLAAQASIDSYGQRRNAGWYLDLLPDGTSRFLIDANYFAITANGGVSYPFTFDGTTLRVPNLVLTSGQASQPLRADIGSYTLVAGQGTLNDNTDANLNFTFNVTNPDFPTMLYLFGRLTVSGTAGSFVAQINGLKLMIDGNLGAYCVFNGQQTSYSGPGQVYFSGNAALYLSAGSHTVTIKYTYSANSSAGKVQIDELHIAGFTPRA